MPMPGVFAAINTRLQGNLVGKEFRSLSRALPEGKVVTQEGWVESKVIPGTEVYIKGKYDLLVERPDKTHLLVDLKISQADEDKIVKYKTQLGAYKFALENPKSGRALRLSRLGLLIFYPEKATFVEGEALLHFPPKWLEVPVDEPAFLSFAREVDKLLAGPVPAEGKGCKWCQYRHVGERLTHLDPVQQDIPF